MGKAHLLLEWPKLLWSRLWIDHMYCFARQWRTLSKFSCFAMEGSHRRLKSMLRKSGGPGLLPGRLGVQVVVDKHTRRQALCGGVGRHKEVHAWARPLDRTTIG